MKTIAKITLAPGQIGFHDELTGITLTVGHPQADIHAGMNTHYIKQAIKDNKITLLYGSLTLRQEQTAVCSRPVIIPIQKEVIKESKKEPIKESVVDTILDEIDPKDIEDIVNTAIDVKKKKSKK